jgi:hypothetical protein
MAMSEALLSRQRFGSILCQALAERDQKGKYAV